jgi:hypothetical protein
MRFRGRWLLVAYCVIGLYRWNGKFFIWDVALHDIAKALTCETCTKCNPDLALRTSTRVLPAETWQGSKRLA